MKAGRDFDMIIATRVLGHPVHQQKRVFFESTAKGTRPLQAYSSNMEAAWEVVQAMGITLIPIKDEAWFALVGPRVGWESPAEFIECMQRGDFLRAGAAVSESAPLSICIAALNAVDKRSMEATSNEPASHELN